MIDAITISVYKVVGSSSCVAADDGQDVYDRTAAALQSGSRVVLSFANVTSLTPAFLNTAIGQLYGKFTADVIREHITVVEMGHEDIALLMRIVETAKRYFKDPHRFNQARAEVLGSS